MKITNIELNGMLLKARMEETDKKDGSKYKKCTINVDLGDEAGTLPTTEKVVEKLNGITYRPARFICEFNGEYQYGASGAFKVIAVILDEKSK